MPLETNLEIEGRIAYIRRQYIRAGGRHGALTTATKRCPPIRWPSPPTLPGAPSGAPPILRRMMASAASCRASPARRQGAGAARRRRSPPGDCAAILATASLPRRTGRGMESDDAAADRGAVDKAIVGLLFQGGMAQIGSGGAPLGGRAGRGGRTRRAGLRSPVENRSGRHRGGRSLPQERLRRRDPPDPRQAHRAAVRIAPGCHGASARRTQRPVYRAPPHRRRDGRRHRRQDHRALRAGRPRFRAHRPRRQSHRDDACWRVENGAHGRPLLRRNRRAGRLQRASASVFSPDRAPRGRFRRIRAESAPTRGPSQSRSGAGFPRDGGGRACV